MHGTFTMYQFSAIAGPMLVLASYLATRDILRFGSCSTTTHQALTSNDLWQKLVVRDFQLVHHGEAPSKIAVAHRRRGGRKGKGNRVQAHTQHAHTAVEVTTVNYKSIYVEQTMKHHTLINATMGPRKLSWEHKWKICRDVSTFILPTVSRALVLFLALLFGLLYADSSIFPRFGWLVVPFAASTFALCFTFTFVFFVAYAWFVGSGTCAKWWGYAELRSPTVVGMVTSLNLPHPTLFQTGEWLDLLIPALPIPWMRRKLAASPYFQDINLGVFILAMVSVGAILWQSMLFVRQARVSKIFSNYFGDDAHEMVFLVCLLPIVIYSACLSSVSVHGTAAVRSPTPNVSSPRLFVVLFALPMLVHLGMRGACSNTWAADSLPCTVMQKTFKTGALPDATDIRLNQLLDDLDTEPPSAIGKTVADMHVAAKPLYQNNDESETADIGQDVQFLSEEFSGAEPTRADAPFTRAEVTAEHILMYAFRLVARIVLIVGIIVICIAVAVMADGNGRASSDIFPSASSISKLNNLVGHDERMTFGLFLEGSIVRIWSLFVWFLRCLWPLHPLTSLNASTPLYILTLVAAVIIAVLLYARSTDSTQFRKSMTRAYFMYVGFGAAVDVWIAIWQNDNFFRGLLLTVVHSTVIAALPMIVCGAIWIRHLLRAARNRRNVISLLVLGCSTYSIMFFSVQHEYGQRIKALGRIPCILAGIPLLVCCGSLLLYSIAAAIATIHASATAVNAPATALRTPDDRVYVDGADRVLRDSEVPVWHACLPMKANPLHH
jgi:hypothetical protein